MDNEAVSDASTESHSSSCGVDILHEFDLGRIDAAIESSRKESVEKLMSQFVLVKELAEYYNIDRSSFTRRLKKNNIEIQKIYHPTHSQTVSVIDVDDIHKVKALYELEHEIVSVDDIMED
jgi:hypothetical protein